MATSQKQEPIKLLAPSVKPKGYTGAAYFLIAKNGGFQPMRVTISDSVVTSIVPISDPDAWNQAMSELEHEISAEFQ